VYVTNEPPPPLGSIESNAFRTDVEGLRGVAILSVVVFHAFPGLLPGGFVGVDIFFVISGYLVTQLLMRRLETGRLSVADFYAARIRRVFPALMLMFAAVTLASCWLLAPAALRELGQTLGYGAFFLANLIFYRLSDYFAGAAEFKPLLHTWSLAVEEQYYLLAPWVMWALHRCHRGRLPHFLAGAAVLFSFCALALATLNPAAAFYGLGGRAGELLAGAAMAGAFTQRAAGEPSTHRQWPWQSHRLWPYAAAVLLGVSLLAPAHWHVPPVVRALVAAVATCLLIGSPGFSAACSAANWLTNPGLRFAGRISYAWYLWHWPVLVLAQYALLKTLNAPERVAALVFAAALAWLTTHWVEGPTRVLPSKLRLWGPVAALSAGACAAVAAGLVLSQGWPQRFDDKALAFFRAAGDNSPARAECHADANRPLTYEQRCRSALTADANTLLVWADSHGVELGSALGESMLPKGIGVAQMTASGCPPSLHFSPRAAPWCEMHNRRILAGIKNDPALQHIVLTARYGRYLEQDESAYTMGFSSLLKELTTLGKRVTLLTPIPAARFDVPVGLGLASARAIEFKPLTLREATTANEPATALLRSLAAAHKAVTVLSLWEAVCNAGECPLERAGRPLYFDDNHLSMYGARDIAKALLQREPHLGVGLGGHAYNQRP
jgi:peptidoglycan/LPS O-acetylase OafA/YrhL/lysophospholipase L1-like esterase